VPSGMTRPSSYAPHDKMAGFWLAPGSEQERLVIPYFNPSQEGPVWGRGHLADDTDFGTGFDCEMLHAAHTIHPHRLGASGRWVIALIGGTPGSGSRMTTTRSASWLGTPHRFAVA
jgi:hypothetical protein